MISRSSKVDLLIRWQVVLGVFLAEVDPLVDHDLDQQATDLGEYLGVHTHHAAQILQRITRTQFVPVLFEYELSREMVELFEEEGEVD